MRKDIIINFETGDLEFKDNNKDSPKLLLKPVEPKGAEDTENFCYGEVEIRHDFYKFPERKILLNIPYNAYYKRLMVRFRLESSSDLPEYIINRTNNSIWFEVVGCNREQVILSEYILIDPSFTYHLVPESGVVRIYSGSETDIVIKESLHANKAFLLMAFKGNLYQHLLTGVGLPEFLNGNTETSDLAIVIQKEFANDGVVVNEAWFDTETNKLYLNIEERDGQIYS